MLGTDEYFLSPGTVISSVTAGASGDPRVFCTSGSYSQLVRDKVFFFLIYKRFKKQKKVVLFRNTSRKIG